LTRLRALYLAGAVLPLASLATSPVSAVGSVAPARRAGRPLASAATAQTLSATLPPNCPAATNPPGAPYGIQFSGLLTSNVTIAQTPLGLPLTVPGVTAAFCGLLQLGFNTATNTPSEAGVVNPPNLVFQPATAFLGAAKIPTVVFAAGPSSTSTPTLVSAQDPRLNLSLSGSVATDTGLLGISCQIGPLNLTLTTASSGGVPLSGPLSGATATLVANGFSVPPVATTGTSGTCPNFLGSQIDSLLGLPNNHTALTANVTIHLCNTPVPTCPLPPVPVGAAGTSGANPAIGDRTLHVVGRWTT
jgi:hypothetical protein